MNEFKKALGMVFVKSDTGNHYLCPAHLAKQLQNASDEVLREKCVDEARRPFGD
jgi:hypothetical protein